MDRRNDPLPAPVQQRPPTLATPFVWAGGAVLLTASTFLVSAIALVRAFGSLFY